MGKPTRITIHGAVGWGSSGSALDATLPPGEYVDAQSYDELVDRVARVAHDLGSYVNYCGSDFPKGVRRDLWAFVERLKTSPAPASNPTAGVLRTAPGAGGDQPPEFVVEMAGEDLPPQQSPAEDTPAGTPPAGAGDGSTPPGDGASAGGDHMLPASACPSWTQRFLPQTMRRDRG